MSVVRGHKIIKVFPIAAEQDTTHATIYMHLDEPYDPPTFVNTVLYQCSNRPNAHTPSAFTWHLRYACKCASVLKHTQANVEGLHIRQGTLGDLPQLLPCSACLAGKLRKNRGQPDKNYTDIENLNNTLSNLPLSWTASTADKNVTPNRTVSIDWGIINKKTQSGKNNVFALFLDIAAQLAPQFPDLHFLLAGDGPEEKMLREKAATLGIAERVTFSGYVADTRLVYLAADVLLMPSRYEGLPMTLLEAMAMGLPVVASQLDGIAEVIGDGREGFLVPSDDASLFVERMAALLQDAELSSRIAQNARAKIEASFSVERMTSAVEEIYDRFLP